MTSPLSASGAGNAHGGGGHGAADRLRQHRQPVARARHFTAQGDRHSHGPQGHANGDLLPPFGLATSFDTSPDARVLGFTLAVTVVTGLLFGLVPALQASRPDLVATLKDDISAVGRSKRRFALRHLLVVAQVALSVLALVGAGLFVRSLWLAQRADPGFNPDGVVLASFDPFLNGYDETRGREFYRSLSSTCRYCKTTGRT